jgi:hypothetical protein
LQAVNEERRPEYPTDSNGKREHDGEAPGAGRDARQDEAYKVLRQGERRGEEIQEIARPDIFGKRRGDSLHDTEQEIPKRDGASRPGRKLKPAEATGLR